MGIRNYDQIKEKLVGLFPSPCGEMGIRNKLSFSVVYTDGEVSVPLRGNGYKERKINPSMNGFVNCFRPLAGKWV